MYFEGIPSKLLRGSSFHREEATNKIVYGVDDWMMDSHVRQREETAYPWALKQKRFAELRLRRGRMRLEESLVSSTNVVRGVPRIRRDISSPRFVRAYVSHTIVLKCGS